MTTRIATKEWYHGIRLSPHVFNTEDHVDRALKAIRTELPRPGIAQATSVSFASVAG